MIRVPTDAQKVDPRSRIELFMRYRGPYAKIITDNHFASSNVGYTGSWTPTLL